MALAFHERHFHVGAHRRFWLIVVSAMAFVLAVLWAQPIG